MQRERLKLEGEEILSTLRRIQLQLECAQSAFEDVTDESLIDSYIYLAEKIRIFSQGGEENGADERGAEKGNLKGGRLYGELHTGGSNHVLCNFCLSVRACASCAGKTSADAVQMRYFCGLGRVFALSGQKPWRGGGHQCRNACGFRISGAARRGRHFSAELFLIEAEGHCGEIC